ncbi:hypothetical protein ADUPG1_002191, partial [Aduncisulcus paluster]
RAKYDAENEERRRQSWSKGKKFYSDQALSQPVVKAINVTDIFANNAMIEEKDEAEIEKEMWGDPDEDFIDTCPIPMCKSPPMNEDRAEELYKRMMIWGTDEDEAMKPNLWTADLDYVPKLDEDESKGGKRRYTPKPKDVEHNHWKEFISELEKEVTMQGDDELKQRRQCIKETEFKCQKQCIEARPQSHSEHTFTEKKPTSHGREDEKMKNSKELERLDIWKVAWSVEPDEISDSEGLKVCVIAGRNHDDSGAVNVT